MVERGTLPGQRTVVDTLADIAARVETEGVRPPAITVVGPVAGLRETLAWLERRPLHGEVVAVTRARAQASGLAARLRGARRRGGGDAGDPDRAAPARGRAARRRAIDRRIRARSASRARTGCGCSSTRCARPARTPASLAGATVAAIGPGTAAELRAARDPRRRACPSVRRRGAGRGARADRAWRVARVLVARAAEARDAAAGRPARARRRAWTRWRSTRPLPSRSATPSGRRSSVPRT